MKKSIIIINGQGASGKDTLIKSLNKDIFKVSNISSITPVKELAINNGLWDGKEKSSEVRKLLSDLKKTLDEYCDFTFKYLKDQYKIFTESEDNVMFVHIREPENIQRFKNFVLDGEVDYCKTLIVKPLYPNNSSKSKKVYGNQSDDNVNNYKYDYIYYNTFNEDDPDNSLEMNKRYFQILIQDIISDTGTDVNL